MVTFFLFIPSLQFETPKEIAEHNNIVRKFKGGHHVPGSNCNSKSLVAMANFYKRYETPTIKEGIHMITTIPFIPFFKSEQDQENYFMFYS